MKITLIAYFGLACVCLAGSDSDAVLRKHLREAAESDGPAYVAIRDRIVADTSTNELYRASSDPALDWKDRQVRSQSYKLIILTAGWRRRKIGSCQENPELSMRGRFIT